jgi:hypothetical protein
MTVIDRQKQTATVSSASVITLGAAISPYRTCAAAIAAGDVPNGATDMEFFVVNPANGAFESGKYTVNHNATSGVTTLTQTERTGSSNNGLAVAFGGVPCEVFSCISAKVQNGTPLADFLAANLGAAVSASDLVLMVQGGQVVGGAAGALATFIIEQWRLAKETTIEVTSTAAIVLDASSQQKKTYFCTTTPDSISGPAVYASVGDGFKCEYVNVSGAPIPLLNMIVLPSGAAIPNKSSCTFKSGGGKLYADLGTAAAAASGTAPGAVTGLTAGTATDVAQPLSYAAPSTGTAPFTYKIEYKKSSDSGWTTANGNVSGTSYTVTGLTAATSYDYRVTPSGSGGSGPAATINGKFTAAASGGSGGEIAPFTIKSRDDFPAIDISNTSGGYWSMDVTELQAGVTVVSIDAAISTSHDIPPTPSIAYDSTPAGSRVAMQIAGGRWVAFGLIAGYAVTNLTNYYFWLFLTDSNGKVWTFRHPNTIQLQTGYPGTPTTVGSAVTLVQV